jgi:hypothetical protein
MVVWHMSPVIKEVNTREELKRAEDSFYDAMFVGDEEKMTAANNAVGYYQSFDSDTCPEHPGF